MAAHVAFSDESGDGQGYSYRAGFIAPESDWSEVFVPAWQSITDRIQDFYAIVPDALLVGEVIPAGKSRLPLQLADMLCWHEQRRDARSWTAREHARFEVLARRLGYRREFTREEIEQFASRATAGRSDAGAEAQD